MSSRRRQITEKIITVLCLLATMAVVGVLFLIVLEIFFNGLPSLNWYFITTPENATPGMGQGIANAIVGTIIISLCATILAAPFGYGTAVYMKRYAADNGITRAFRFLLEVLSGTPSIVLGVFGFLVFVIYLKKLTGGYSLIAGAIALAILIMPVIERAIEDAIDRVPKELEEGSYALGANKWQTIRDITIPAAFSGILTGLTLGFGRAAEESAVVILTAGYTQYLPEFAIRSGSDAVGTVKIYPLQDQVATLPYAVYHAFQNQIVVKPSAGFAAAFILIAVVFSINIAGKTLLRSGMSAGNTSGSWVDTLKRKIFPMTKELMETRTFNKANGGNGKKDFPVPNPLGGNHGILGKNAASKSGEVMTTTNRQKSLPVSLQTQDHRESSTNRKRTEFIQSHSSSGDIPPFEPLFEGEPQPVIPLRKPVSMDTQIGFIDKIIEDLETEIRHNPESARKSIISPEKPVTFIHPDQSGSKISGKAKTPRNSDAGTISRSVNSPATPESANSTRSIVKIILDVETDSTGVSKSTPSSIAGSLNPRPHPITRISEHPLPDRDNKTPSVSQREIGGMKISGPQPEIDDRKEPVLLQKPWLNDAGKKTADSRLKSPEDTITGGVVTQGESDIPDEAGKDAAQPVSNIAEIDDPESREKISVTGTSLSQEEIAKSAGSTASGEGMANEGSSGSPALVTGSDMSATEPEIADKPIEAPDPKTTDKKPAPISPVRSFFRTLFPFIIPAILLLFISVLATVPPLHHALGPVSESLASIFASSLSLIIIVSGLLFALFYTRKSGAFKKRSRRIAYNSVAAGFCVVVIAGIICSSASMGFFSTGAGNAPMTAVDRAAKLAAMAAAGDPLTDQPASSGNPAPVAPILVQGDHPITSIPIKDALSLGEIYQYGDSHHHIKVTVYDEKVLPYYFWWWIDYNRFVQSMPATGNSYLVVYLRVENTGDQSAVIPTADTFTVGYNGNSYTRLPYMNTSVISAFQANSLRDPVKREQYYQWIREIGESKRDYAYLTGQTYFADSWLDNSTDSQNSTSTTTVVSTGNSTYGWYYLKPGVSQAVDGYLVYEVPDAVATHLSTTYLNAVFNQISATRWKLG